VRVLMTGGYGCIGSWVTRELVERGYDVWIFDLKEDTHRLDLVLDPEKRSKVRFVAGDGADLEGVRAAVHGPVPGAARPGQVGPVGSGLRLDDVENKNDASLARACCKVGLDRSCRRDAEVPVVLRQGLAGPPRTEA
jgi:hypothetical protein